jgi:hypothetical protein
MTSYATIGMMKGAGTGIAQGGEMGQKSALEEIRLRRVAEIQTAQTDYKIAAEEASVKRMAPHKLAQKEAELELTQKYGKKAEPWAMNDGTLYNKQTGETKRGSTATGLSPKDEAKYREEVAKIRKDVALYQATDGMEGISPEAGKKQEEVINWRFRMGEQAPFSPRTKPVGDRTFRETKPGKWEEVIGEDEKSEKGKSPFVPVPRPGDAMAPATAPATAQPQAETSPKLRGRGLIGDNPFIDPDHLARLEQARQSDELRVQAITESVKALPGKAADVANDAKMAVTAGAAARRVREALKGGWKPSARDIKLAESKLTEHEKQQLRDLKQSTR